MVVRSALYGAVKGFKSFLIAAGAQLTIAFLVQGLLLVAEQPEQDDQPEN